MRQYLEKMDGLGKPLRPQQVEAAKENVAEIERIMLNDLVRHYEEISRPLYCAKTGFVDEVVRYEDIRKHMVAFANSAYQHPPSICPHHHMILPRMIRSQLVTGLLR